MREFVVAVSLCWGMWCCQSVFFAAAVSAQSPWKKHVVHEGLHNTTAIAGDFTKDGAPDVIFNAAGRTRLLVAPDWKEIVLDATPGYDFIHSEAFDVDGDGDLDWIGARYSPGLVVWLEQPNQPLTDKWPLRIADEQLNGIHGVLQADVDGDGRMDLLANSGQPTGPWANSAAWLRAPLDPRATHAWERIVFADGDASGLSHYFGAGDVNGDGRLDICLAAKGGPQAEPGTGEWYAWWEAPTSPRARGWKKHVIATGQPGATNIMPADVNRDGKVDFIATRGHDRGVVWFEAPQWKLHTIHPTLKEPHSLVVRDLDGDGDLDAATCGYGDREVWWFENDGRGGFRNHQVAADQAAYDIRAFDMDRDGDLDLLIAGQQSKNVVWYENPR
ncbi:MAG: VCBS repeat-containing protein [Pirellulales bacterium]